MRNKYLAGLATLIVLIGMIHQAAFGAALDPTFGLFGATYVSVESMTSHGQTVLIRPDGKIILAGYRHLGLNPPDAQLVRYNSDGTLDNTFGTNGVKFWGLQTPRLKVWGAALQSDGKILMVGEPGAAAGAFVLLRALPDGTLDPDFGVSGQVSKNIGGGSGFCVVIQPSGKIVVGGTYHPSANVYDLAFVRFNPDGTTDNSFGPSGNGIVTVAAGDIATSLVQAPDGKLVSNSIFDLNNTLPSFGDADMTVFRMSADGIPDASFGTNGLAQMDFVVGAKAYGVAVQADGKVVVAGATRYQVYSNPPDPFRGDWGIGRFNSDGSVDTTFGVNGRVKLDFIYRAAEVANTVLVEPTGNILVAGKVVARFSPTGALLGMTDPSTRHDPGRFNASINSLALQPDGKILAGGDSGGVGSFVGLARYNDITSINNSTIKFDFDGDAVSDFGVYRAGATSSADSYWYGNFSMNIGNIHFFQQRYGVGADIIVPGDYDGDRRTDYAVFRPADGNWYSTTQPDGDLSTHYIAVHWGQAGDVPAPGDFDGDGVCDRAVFRPSTGGWYVLGSAGSVISAQFGLAGDKPVAADYDNDGKADFAVVRDQGGTLVWYILQSGDNSMVSIGFGNTGDRLVPTDYDGDGRAEIAVFRAGAWYFLTNYNTFSVRNWGTSGDIPAPADFDGDEITDLAVFRPGSPAYYILNSTDGIFTQNFGVSVDLPISAAYVR